MITAIAAEDAPGIKLPTSTANPVMATPMPIAPTATPPFPNLL